jgi:two-component system chemotaxis sensor kinase CheA
MKFRTKLYLGFAFVLLIIILTLYILMNMFNQLDREIRGVVQERYEIVKLTNNIQYELNNVSGEARGLLANPPAEIIPVLVKNKEQAFLNAQLAMESLEKLDTNKESQELILKLRTLSETYYKLLDKSYEFRNAGKEAEANRLLWGESRQAGIQMAQVVNELKRTQEQAMKNELEHADKTYNLIIKMIYVYAIASLAIGSVITLWVIREITRNLNKVTSVMTKVSYSKTDKLPRIDITSKDEIGDIARAFNEMSQTLEERAKHEKEMKTAAQEQSWLKSSIAEIATMYPGVGDLQTLARLFITKITPMVGADYGVFYIKEGKGNEQYYRKLASYGGSNHEIGIESFRFGEGLAGQCAAENRTILLTNVPENYVKITSAMGKASPNSIIILPAEFEKEILAVVELASFDTFSPLQQMLLKEVMGNIGVTIKSISSHMQVEKLLQESQALTEELQSQSEELRLQQEELRTTNEKLEEQYESSEQKTKELEKIRLMLEEKAQQLALSSRYKSEFLANMSHELRTPLNSLLILAQMLAGNADGNLTSKQIEYANTIYSSGNDLLKLINDILDLAKIESRKIDIIPEEVKLNDIQVFMEKQFSPIARQKGIQFTVQLTSDLPEVIYTDEHRLRQILGNLLSNSFKFTHEGNVSLLIQKADKELCSEHRAGNTSSAVLAFSVIDTGIGIPKEKQSTIFEAFRQADGTTSRKYGGTGLGLSISQELAQLLGGFIDIHSTEGKGSTFTLYLPDYDSNMQTAISPSSEMEVAAGLFEEFNSLSAQLEEITSQSNETVNQSQYGKAVLEGKKVLVVDDDIRNVFALTTALEELHMKVIFAENGREGIEVLKANPDTDLILMDIMMPEMDGFEAMRTIRQMPEGQMLPIIALTAKAMKHDKKQCIDAGASDYISKPVNLEQLFSLMRVWLYT